MQVISSTLKAALLDIDARVTPRILVDLVELYSSDYVPTATGFDPVDAIETFAAEEITWNGIAYRRELSSGNDGPGRSDITRNMGEKTNSVTLSFSNISRYMATLAQSQTMEGLFCVIRCVAPSVTDDSLVLFVGRCDKPSDVDKRKFTMSARQDFGNINQTLPPRKFTAEDPEGRTPDDPLYEGISFTAIAGSFTTPKVVLKSGIAGLLGRRKTINVTQQFSDLDDTPYGSVVPEMFGRGQLQLIPFAWIDKGVFVSYLMAVCAGPIKAIENIKSRTEGVSDPLNLPGPVPAEVHLGDLGGTGTNVGNVFQADLGGGQVFSHLAYIEGASVPNELLTNPSFSDPDVLNEPPIIVAIILGRIVPVPDSDGEYTLEDWTDNPVHIARFILTHESFVNINPAFMEDAVNFLTAQHCDEPIMDDTTSQMIVVPSVDAPQAGVSFSRFQSTGQINARHFLYNDLGDVSIIPETSDGPYVPYDPIDPVDGLLCSVGYHRDLSGVCVPDVQGSTTLPGDVQLTSGVALGSQTVAEGAWKFYYITVPAGATQLEVVATGSGDAELYTRALAKPDRTTYDDFAYNASPEICTNANPVQGTWFVGVFGRTGGASYSLTATVTGGSGGTGYSPINGGQALLRARYRANFPITEEIRAVDLLFKILFPAFKGFMKVNKRGKYEILSEQPSDSTRIRSSTAVAATSIPVLDVTPWKSGPNLLMGRLLMGVNLITAEVRNVSSADYSTSGNSITLSATASGSMTATASGATLSGGSTSVQASGTVTIGGTPETGKIVTITIDGISIAYVLGSDDTTGTVAAMLSAYINATPRLRKYVLASWDASTPTVITIKCLHGALNLDSALLKAHTGPIADPTAAPTIAGSGSGALAAGTYQVAYANETANGLTALTPIATVLLTVNQKIDVSSLPAFPGTVTGRQFFVSDAPNSTNLRWAVTRVNASDFSINALPLPGAAMPPSYNTTAEELIRVAMSFATNSQDVFPSWRPSTLVILNDIYLPDPLNGHKYQATSITTGITAASAPIWPTTAGGTVVDSGVTWTEIGSTVLQQAGLTRANIVKDTFKWPLGSQQSSVNQIKISYRSATDDFALVPYRVNDPVHQAQVKKIYPLEVDGSAIDNFHQMFRIANWTLSKNREGDWFNSLETGPQGLVLEEGDVICSSDDSGGLVNVPTRIEELRIKANHEVSITLARKYSTTMFSDDVGSHRIAIPSTLRFVQTVDSIIEFIDTPPIRDADGLTPGFYVAVSRDLSIDGDWRGWSLWADYGDGYKVIASGDVAATIGVTTDTLADVADATVLDVTGDLTFTLKYAVEPISFSNLTEAEMEANPLRNLFLVGDEYVQAGTIVDNGNRSFTISDLFHARFETDCVSHSAGERVIYMNGAEMFIPTDVARIGIEYNYKAVTVNQDVVDATEEPFTWAGKLIKPAAPTDLDAVKDSSGDWRIAAVGRPKEYQRPESYIARIRRVSDDAIMRDIPITPGIRLAATLLPVVHTAGGGNWIYSGPANIVNNNLYGVTDNWSHFYATQPVQEGSEVNACVTVPAPLSGLTGVVRMNFGPGDYTDMVELVGLHLENIGNSTTQTRVKVFDWTSNQSEVINVPSVGGVVFVRIVWSGTELRFQLAGSPIDPRVTPSVIFRDVPSPSNPNYLRISLYNGGPFGVVSSKVEAITIGGSQFPQTIYTLGQQVNDDTTNDKAFTENAGTDVLTSTAHGYAANTKVMLRNVGGGLPAGLNGATGYFVRDVTTDTFKLAATIGGAAIDITSAGTGTQYVSNGMSTIDVEMWQVSPIPGVQGFSIRGVFP